MDLLLSESVAMAEMVSNCSCTKAKREDAISRLNSVNSVHGQNSCSFSVNAFIGIFS